jgi:hypothetical protein
MIPNLIDEWTEYSKELADEEMLSESDLFQRAYIVRENVRQYLCACGVEPVWFPEYFAFAVGILKLNDEFSQETLQKQCQKRFAEWASRGCDVGLLGDVLSLQGFCVQSECGPVADPAVERPSCVAPVPAVVPRWNPERASWQNAVLFEAHGKIRSKLLLSRGGNVCCGVLSRVETEACFLAVGVVSSRAWWVCPICGRSYGEVSKRYVV